MVLLFNQLDIASGKLYTPGSSYEEVMNATKKAGEERWGIIKAWLESHR